MENKKVFVLGSINVDLVVYAEHFPEKGETVFGKEFLINQGGKGANQAVASKKASGNTTFIGRVGRDIFGKIAEDSLKSFEVNYFIIHDEDTQTGIALINVDKDGNNRITIIEGANGKVGKEEIDYLEKNITSGDILLLQGEIKTTELLKAVKIAKGRDAIVIFDPAPVRKDLVSIIPYVDYITPNEIELQKLTLSYDPKELLKFGAKNVIFKMGEKGVLFINDSKELFVKAYSVNAVDTTGAGDTFNGSFASALSKNVEIEKALKFATASAAISVTRKGAAISSPTYEEIIKFLEEHNEKFI